MALLLGGMYHGTRTCSLASNMNSCLHENFVIPKLVLSLCVCRTDNEMFVIVTCVLHRL